MVKITVDRQGRIVLPRSQRQRLGVEGGNNDLELVTTPEGVALEPRREVTLSTGADGVVVATVEGAGTIDNATVLQAIHSDRDAR